MPELAEVETVRRVLRDKILNKKIINVNVLYPKMLDVSEDFFKNNLINDNFIDIQRRGKYLIFETSKHFLISHLRMEGKFFIKEHDSEIVKHEHIIFKFADFDLRYHDTRKFGRMTLILKSELENFFNDLGPDANTDIDSKYLYHKIHKKNIPIKTALLDQNILAGLGNIYVDEVLYASKISPLRDSSKIKKDECALILKYSKEILDKAILHKGTTIRSYTSSLNVIGDYQKFLKVHTKEGNLCECGGQIKKIRIGGRGTYFCPKCQK